MKLSDFITEDSVVEELKAVDKESAIRELADTLRKAGLISEQDMPEIVKALIRREQLGSTGIGRGFAVPHTKIESVKKLTGAFGCSPKGIEFKALDGEPVQWIFLLLSPKEFPREHLAALEHISKLLRSEAFCRGLKTATSKQDIWAIIQGSSEYVEQE